MSSEDDIRRLMLLARGCSCRRDVRDAVARLKALGYRKVGRLWEIAKPTDSSSDGGK